MKTITISTVTVGTATGTITSNNTNVSNNDTVTIGTKTYTFKTTLTPAEGEVLRGADADASLLNLIRAINHSGTPDTDYKCAAANADVTAATSVTSHSFAITARESGLDGNSIATTTTAATLSWGAATLTGGQALSITGTVSDVTFSFPSQIATVSVVPSANQGFYRNARLTNAALFCKRNGVDSVALYLSSWFALASAIESGMTWAPRITTQPTDSTTSVGADDTFSVVANTADELAPAYEWQRSSDDGDNWVTITASACQTDNGVASTYLNYTTATLTVNDPAIGMDAYLYRCILTNNAGSATSDEAMLTVE
jgi:hypothetical protein